MKNIDLGRNDTRIKAKFPFSRLFLLLTLISVPGVASAQSTPPAGVTIPPTTPETIDQTIPKSSPSPATPTPPSPTTTPILPVPPVPTPSDVNSPIGESFLVKKIEVLGATVLKNEIAKLIEPFEKRQVTFADLIQLRSDITELYIQNGYITSGAFLPNNQNLTDGVVKIQVVEGELEKIEITGLRSLQSVYVRSRLAQATSTPLNRQRLEAALQLLQLDPVIQRVNAELSAGSTAGSNILLVNITEAPAFHGGVFTANNQTPSVGSTQLGVFLNHDNLLGFGDRLAAEYTITEGLNLYDVSYTIPLNGNNDTLSFRVNNANSRIITDDFRDLNIRSETQTYSLSYRHPLYRQPQTELGLSLGLDLRRSQTFLLENIPFSFSPGAEDGESKITAIRFSQDWVKRDATRVLAARSQFSIGIGAFDATVNDTDTDGRFFSWLGQFQWVQLLSSRTLILTRVNAQLTGDSLLSLEKFSIGGFDTVRGYTQNKLVADNGFTASIEVRLPLTANSNALQIAPFFDIGTVWNNRGGNPQPQTISSLGLGLLWQPSRDLNLRLDYGIPLTNINDGGNTLQENGIHFSLRYQPF
ncbi:ShlB/FhaC/HecB family hemolysin secretion/activation protein [Anabaena sp. FACHB-709]|uniref:Surface antigen D15 domain-containing protein n=2 Tax=Nostocaceae TaxID=1162 RepID=A0A1Z4KEA4_ANAVA|nr:MULTISPECIES: ShlB/FhaC/HecB family hemolysin secretion/activation protein [Nostocaceae]BAY67279.1 surface antigen D15 domain-containing protein [Trichormus variabilis NIES-23]HBW30399.1 ShlB/FhaC/HecB family hemolysin secretion/activation protein [Nostoc sp. UBA8866]MBD2173122.1 ShlB/FhaC/HecB family hemolysin secretion/activation protein [Anabaena cylindrica FACHB-318]MBD2264889.1 ShlB/FhaC/HecB family hemolysin secretion/activation protein [Anabaena sp. FACHB-709]MBD2274046.1 ShlB/FhaC/H